MNFKGVYEAQLIHKDTGEVLQEERFENLITDTGYSILLFGTRPSYLFIYSGSGEGGQDYRRVSSPTSVPGFTRQESNYASASSLNNSNSVRLTYSFAAPVTTIDISAFGSGSSSILYSFVSLTNPIVQTPETILYLSYTIHALVSNNSASMGAVSNAWVNASILNTGGLLYNRSLDEAYILVTPYFLEDKNNAGRSVKIPGGTTSDRDAIIELSVERSNDGWSQSTSLFKVQRTLPITISQYYGMHATTVYTMGDRDVIVAASGNAKNPQIRPIIQHGVGDNNTFTNASVVPQGQGTLQTSGTPVCGVLSKYVDFSITKSGDACDLYQEEITFDSTTDSFTPQTSALVDWDNEDRGVVKVSFSGGTLPVPLVEGQVYYLIYNASVLKIALSEADAIAGTAIDLLDNGTGTHTITRESTAKFKVTTNTVIYPHNHRLRMHPTRYNDGSFVLQRADVTSANVTIAWTVQVGEYVYYCVNSEMATIPSNRNMLLCKWKMGYLDQPETLASIPAYWSTFVKVGEDIVINTDGGILICDTTTDTIYLPTTISEVTSYNGLAYDEVSETVVCLHNAQGFSVFSVPAFKADGTVLDTVLFSENTFLNGIPTEGKTSLNVLDFFDKVLTWSTDTITVIYHWDTDIRTGTGTHRTHSSSYWNPPPQIKKTGDKDIYTVERYSTSYYFIKKATASSAYSTVTTIMSTPSGLPLQGFAPFIDSLGIFRWVLSTDRYALDTATDEVRVVTRRTSPAIFNPSLGRYLPKASMGVFDDTPMILAGYWFEPLDDTVSISGGKIALTPQPQEHILQLSEYPSLINGLNFKFNNAAGISSENQFLEGERYTALISAMILKTNLDEAESKFVLYYTDTQKKADIAYIVGGDTITVTEASETDFRAIDFVTITKGGTPVTNFSVSATTGVITFTDSSHDGQEVLVTYSVVYRR